MRGTMGWPIAQIISMVAQIGGLTLNRGVREQDSSNFYTRRRFANKTFTST